MQWDQLNHFYETAKRVHIGRAADFLHVSPSGISYSITCLENDLGAKLFEKRGRRIVLTDAGQRLLEKIPELKRNLEEIRNHVASADRALDGHFKVGAVHVYCELGLVPLVNLLLKKHPCLSLDLLTLRSADVVVRVLDQSLDLGICFSPQKHPHLESRVLSQGRLKVYVRSDHPIFKHKEPLYNLKSYRAVMPKAFGGIDVCESHPVLKAHGIKPNVSVSFDSYGVGLKIIAGTDGWGFFPDWLENTPRFPLKAIDLPPTWSAHYTLQALWTKHRPMSIAVNQLLTELTKRN